MKNKFNILLAEDEPANQLLFERMIKTAGHNVTIANNGREALDYLNTHSYDLGIFDMRMPEMNGIEVVELYKNNKIESTLPFIMLTADTGKDVIEQCKSAGIDIYLSKPITSKDLIKAINTACIGKSKSKITQADSIIDITQLDYFEDQDFLDKYIELFEESAEKLVKNLADALDNYKYFMDTVHSIKGLSGNIGAHDLREITIQAGSINKNDFNKKAKEFYEKIINELSKVVFKLITLSSKNIVKKN